MAANSDAPQQLSPDDTVMVMPKKDHISIATAAALATTDRLTRSPAASSPFKSSAFQLNAPYDFSKPRGTASALTG
jgi:hypothetical protein